MSDELTPDAKTGVNVLSPEELAEIERKVARFREVVTKAAIRRRAKKPNPSLDAKRGARAQLDDPAVQIALIERVLAGATYTELAPEYLHSPSFLSYHLDAAMRDQLEYVQWSDDPRESRAHYECEWSRCMRASRKERHEFWYPLALQRMKEKLP